MLRFRNHSNNYNKAFETAVLVDISVDLRFSEIAFIDLHCDRIISYERLVVVNGTHLNVVKETATLVGANVTSDSLRLTNTPLYTIKGTRAEVAIGILEALVAVLRNTFVDAGENRASKASKDTLGGSAVGGDIGEAVHHHCLRDSLGAASGNYLAGCPVDAQAETATIILAALLATMGAAHGRSRALSSFTSVEYATLLRTKAAHVRGQGTALS